MEEAGVAVEIVDLPGLYWKYYADDPVIAFYGVLVRILIAVFRGARVGSKCRASLPARHE